MSQEINENKEHGQSITEQQLIKVVDNMLEGVQIIDFNWKYLYVNGTMTQHGKYSKDEFIGYTVMEKYPGIEQTEVYNVYLKCFNERVPVHMENRFVFPDGSVGWFELSFQPVPEGIFILSIDITERKNNEEKVKKLNEELEQKVAERTAELESRIQQLKESEEKFEKAFNGSGVAIAITRMSDASYLDINEAFATLSGYKRDELIGHTSIEIGMVLDTEKRSAALQQIRENGFIRDFEIEIINKNGKTFTILSSVETILIGGEKYALNIIYDITERKKAEAELEAANKELEAFSYTVSHDLRSPLRAVDGYARILEDDYSEVLDDEGKRLLSRIQYNAKKMSTLIDDLLAFSRLGRKSVQKSTIHMNELVDSVINRATVNHATITIGKLHDVPGDYSLMSQVMTNLISNAIKYSSKTAEPKILISSEETEKAIIYSIKDNGEGFDMKYANKLFGVFQRLHSVDEFEGTGVGLAIVERIISKHGGRIWAEAEPGKGATFSFLLPKD